MSEITKIAEKAAEEIYGHVDTDGHGGILFDREKIVKVIEEAARAAIEAYEAAKRAAGLDDHLAVEARQLYKELVGDAYPTQTHKQRMEEHRALNKHMNDVLNRLAEKKP